MKKICLLLLGFMVIFPAHSQFIKNLDHVSSFSEGLLAIKKNSFAVVMNFTKEVVGKNKLLNKDVVNYELEEFVIDLNGKAMTQILNPRHFVPDKMKLGKTPALTASLIGERMVSVKIAEKKWEIYRF